MLTTILQHLIKHRFFGHSGGPSSAPPSPQGRKRRAATLIAATFSIVVGGGLGNQDQASAQTAVYYGKIDETLRTDLVQWSAHYWDRVDTGNTVKVGDFKFTDPALNTPLFNPARAVRPTLEQLKLVSTLDCDGVTVLTPGFGNAAIANSFRQAMSEWKLVTDSSTNASGTAIHMNLITSAPAGSGTTWEVIGNEVISTKLPWAGVAGVNTNPTIAPSISTSTQAAIDKLITVGSIIAAASEGISEAQSLITGQESHATKFERGVQQLLIEGGWNGTTWRVDAAFGVFGSLPLVGVTFDDAFVLVDTVNGNVDGPFTLTSTLDSRPLLEVHVSAYTLGTTIRHLSTLGCITTARARWRTPFPPGGPFVQRPGSPNTPTPPYIIPGYGPGGPQLHPENPGWFTDWQCFTKIDGFNHSCECYAYGKYDNTSTGSSYWVRIKCVLNGGYTLLPGGLPELTTPFVPITNPSVPQGPPFPQPDPSISPATWNCNVPAGPYPGTEWYY